jgi:translation elongation factor EF-Tu-like GTPase
VLRAVVKSSFELSGRGTVLVIDLLEGAAKPGEMVRLALGDRTLEGKVIGVEFVDQDVGGPTFHADVALVVAGLEPGDVPPGTVVSSP